MMKKLSLPLVLLALLGITSCYDHPDHGPRGRDGRAFFGVDYSFAMPYSYWDDNPKVPANPYFGEFYRSEAGWYDFEYFIDPTEYWYGSYHIQVEPGLPGRPYGEVGEDGLDSYLVLFLDPDGWSEDRFASKSNVTMDGSDDHATISMTTGSGTVTIDMHRTDISERPTLNVPKFRKQSKATLARASALEVE